MPRVPEEIEISTLKSSDSSKSVPKDEEPPSMKKIGNPEESDRSIPSVIKSK